MSKRYLILTAMICLIRNGAFDEIHRSFPKGFQFGVSTSSYQIEGAWNISGTIAIVLHGEWYEPYDPNNQDDVTASETAMQFAWGWFANPIYSKSGDYPKVMKDKILKKSLEQGYSESRLPEFTNEEIDYIKGTSVFFGLNHYTSSLVRPSTQPLKTEPSIIGDAGIEMSQDPDWPSSPSVSWFKVVPWGFHKLLSRITKTYNNPEIFVTENGYCDLGEIADEDRINYHHQYLNAMLDAIDEGCKVTGYTIWSLMDNFEWTNGYHPKFGLYSVDFNDSKRKRTAKNSAKYYQNVIKTRIIVGTNSPSKYL